MSIIEHILEHKERVIHAVSPDVTLHDAASIMTVHGVSSLLVRADQVYVGILSERDIVQRLAQTTGSICDTPVWQVMHEICDVDCDEDIQHAMGLMTDRRIRHLLVRDHGEPIGVISIGDLVKAYIDDREGAITSLSHYIAGIPD